MYLLALRHAFMHLQPEGVHYDWDPMILRMASGFVQAISIVNIARFLDWKFSHCLKDYYVRPRLDGCILMSLHGHITSESSVETLLGLAGFRLFSL